jgi:hypothetical protein
MLYFASVEITRWSLVFLNSAGSTVKLIVPYVLKVGVCSREAFERRGFLFK